MFRLIPYGDTMLKHWLRLIEEEPAKSDKLTCGKLPRTGCWSQWDADPLVASSCGRLSVTLTVLQLLWVHGSDFTCFFFCVKLSKIGFFRDLSCSAQSPGTSLRATLTCLQHVSFHITCSRRDVSAVVSVTPLGVFKETAGQFQAVVEVTKKLCFWQDLGTSAAFFFFLASTIFVNPNQVVLASQPNQITSIALSQ